jgi:hypothetical protein
LDFEASYCYLKAIFGNFIIVTKKQNEKLLIFMSSNSKNISKYLSYKEAWTRIEQAQKQDFYLEAVTLEESVMTDRLISYLVKKGVIEPSTKLSKYNFSNLIQLWKEQNAPIQIKVKAIEINNLQIAVDRWRERRNKIVHGMVKSHPGHPTEDIVDFLAEAKLTAKEGENLARAVSYWVQKQKTKVNSSQP